MVSEFPLDRLARRAFASQLPLVPTTKLSAPLGRSPIAPEWCHVCCTRHPVDALCPGDVHVTEAERFGWKVFVETPLSTEAYGVLVAPAGRLWRARILTYPSTLWTVPGGRGVMKFLGRTPQQAEEQAIRFIEEYCAQRKYLPRTGLELASNLPAGAHAAPVSLRPAAPSRWPLIVPVQYALEQQLAKAVTRNVSEGGVFIQTPLPPSTGLEIRFELVVRASALALNGVVVWVRREAEIGRPPGMGVHINAPPRVYLEFVRSLPPPNPAEGF